ncbi:MAG: hypothetical protein Q9178_003897 [Gyalolechia marmorata]
MSQYLNSLLIEPVVRQARRFSRPSSDDRPLYPVRRHLSSTENASDNGAEISLRDEGDSTVRSETVRPKNSCQMNLDRLAPQATETVTAEPDAIPRYSEDSLEAEVRDLRHAQEPSTTAHEESWTPAMRPDSAPPEEQISSNPVYDIPESLRSTTSSLGESVHSITDSDAVEVQVSARSSLQYPRAANGHPLQVGDGTLPADDGMSSMRKRIVAIHRTDSSNTEKAKSVHRLMSEGYSPSQPSPQAPLLPRPRSPVSLTSHERPGTHFSDRSRDNSVTCTSQPATLPSTADADDPFNLCTEDLKPTYFQKPKIQQPTTVPRNRSSDRFSQDSNDEFRVLGCPHYRRNIKLQCSSCYRWYTCRFCHDEVENHLLNRRETRNMLCMFCGCAQPASKECIQCGERSARYYCSVCKFWDDDPAKQIYHCNDCGICRIGQGLGKDFFHCKTCCACLSIRTLENHRCIERSTDCDCPICGEYMFTSPQAVIFMKCGHSIHLQCYYEHAKRSYRCPICSKSMANMEPQFRQLERSIESQPMPPEFQNNKALVYCNDCNAKSSVKYHWLGLKCGVCDSYNTAQLQIIRGADPRSIPIDLAQTSPGSRPRDRATDPTAQASRAINPPSAAVVSPAQDLPRPVAEPSNLQGSPREAVATDEYRDSLEAVSDEDYSDVNFWGFESPNARGPSVSPDRLREDGNRDETDSEDDGSDNDYTAPGDAEDDGDDNDEEDQMEIFGHR